MVSTPPMIGQSPDSPEPPHEQEATTKPVEALPAKEYGGRDGPEPTRYGDWEKNGRCIDF
ncbi:MAG TPA: DUF1674 domain-containing protein [Arenimonas sp.]|uniref:DUF1674 domain-containing protein n=1 Tax=Arenimonas sp. TaxID=1872635 RepID=UPI002D15FC71|nr:DUF1674 domain-containing protein [Arenimonas sp.]HMB57327.1 DUF1674 domain-containing protein [Arenimonas sp.]